MYDNQSDPDCAFLTASTSEDIPRVSPAGRLFSELFSQRSPCNDSVRISPLRVMVHLEPAIVPKQSRGSAFQFGAGASFLQEENAHGNEFRIMPYIGHASARDPK